MLRNLAESLILYETIDTTEAKAKETKSFVERLIARNKAGDLASKRNAAKALFNKNAVKKLVNELSLRYESKKSGFIKSYRLKNRLGDNSSMMRLELVDKKFFVTKTDETKEKPKASEKKQEVKNDKK